MQLRRSDQDVLDLRRAIEAITAGHAVLAAQPTGTAMLKETATLAAHALKALCCVASHAGESAGASGEIKPDEGMRQGDSRHPRQPEQARGAQAKPAQVIVASAPCRGGELTLTLTVSGEGESKGELLSLIATVAATTLDCILSRPS